MERIFKEHLFTKQILVSDKISANTFEIIYTLGKLFGIKILKGAENVNLEMISLASEMIGLYVPDPFYVNFPNSVRNMTKDQLQFDQLLHYFQTYGLGNFIEPGKSLFEEELNRTLFKEDTKTKEFVVLKEEEALTILKEDIENLLKGTRPLSYDSYELVKAFILKYDYLPNNIPCKDTAIQLLADLRNLKFRKYLKLADVLKVVEYINYDNYYNMNIKKLAFKNKDRQFITKLIDAFFQEGNNNIKECFEKKAIWCGLLHHIHYISKTAEAEYFVTLIRGDINYSVYSEFEKHLQEGNIDMAVNVLKKEKGASMLLRNLNYLLSRCHDDEEISFVLNNLDTNNKIILLQLLIQYNNYSSSTARNFKFTRFNMLKVHTETTDEYNKRQTKLTEELVLKVQDFIFNKLKELLNHKVGKVYLSQEMYNIALPLQENTSSKGYGVLPKGSIIPLKNNKKIRAFTYWEKVNDIDLSVIGINEYNCQEEFSWRTMYENQSLAITYSGDQTSGYLGGSEYFDIDIAEFKVVYPYIKYLIFSNNVYSLSSFKECFCKAGFMLRDIEDSGKVFEPKTVETSFQINCDSSQAYLFAVDLEKNNFVWLNINKDSNARVAGATNIQFLIDYLNVTDIINVGTLFEMMAEEIVDDPLNADIIVSDTVKPVKESQEVIHSYDFEKIISFLN